jgi:hypothetical protein
VSITHVIQIVNETPWWTPWIQVLAPLVAVGIAVGSAMRDNRLRKRDATALADRDQEADDRRARYEAEKVVFEYTRHHPISHWHVTNASDGPILDLEITQGVPADPAAPEAHMVPYATRLRPVLLAGEGLDMPGQWKDASGQAIEGPQQPSSAFPVASWRDGSGRVWFRNADGLFEHRSSAGKMGRDTPRTDHNGRMTTM